MPYTPPASFPRNITFSSDDKISGSDYKPKFNYAAWRLRYFTEQLIGRRRLQLHGLLSPQSGVQRGIDLVGKTMDKTEANAGEGWIAASALCSDSRLDDKLSALRGPRSARRTLIYYYEIITRLNSINTVLRSTTPASVVCCCWCCWCGRKMRGSRTCLQGTRWRAF